MIEFLKMQGCGNDFVLVNSSKCKVDNPAELSQKICHRRFGVGGDGLILALPSDQADLRMRIFNPDGSEAEMCGNGIRCFYKFACREGLACQSSLTVETLAGIIRIQNQGDEVRVDMGEPVLEAQKIPVNMAGEKVINEELWVDRKHFRVTCVSMGNPHCIIFVSEITDELVLEWGPKIEKHGIFPKRTNTEFAKVLSRSEIQMRVYERGAGETLACGTGACATAVAAVLNNMTDCSVCVHLLGGDLKIEWFETDNHVFMTGPAEAVFEGKWLG